MDLLKTILIASLQRRQKGEFLERYVYDRSGRYEEMRNDDKETLRQSGLLWAV
ncbi:hypothetical protein DPMN_120033 [Dreissena polymorpha]|uniref:Uncharacterized protein n=1 Tax=Dreissena polymorpha TaxID=45954 RepID=A0A9D4JSF8_DREPO|nr:hypothetical protein DPMN_120033 [Dreissena polymorpha]